MIYGFDTSDETAATGALLVYAVYRSRDKRRYKVTPDMWSQIERFAKDSAKRAKSLPAFLEAFKPRLACGSVQPCWMGIGDGASVPLIAIHSDNGRLREFIQPGPDAGRREFMTALIERADARMVIRRIYEETAWIVLLARDRLEREKPLDAMLDRLEDHDGQLSA